MKNIHLLPTDKPSKIFYIAENFHLEKGQLIEPKSYHNVYITSDEEIKEVEYGIDIRDNRVFKCERTLSNHYEFGVLQFQKSYCKTIILTTDQDLIKNGVQAIDDNFLEWFIKNPSCESVEVIPLRKSSGWYDEKEVWHWDFLAYKIIITKEEPKQETLEEAAENYVEQITEVEFGKPHNAPHRVKSFIDGAKWQSERMYSEEDLLSAFEAGMMFIGEDKGSFREWFEKFKKK